MKRALIVLVALAGFSTPVYAASLSDFIGVWRGKGTYTRSGASDSEGKLTCKLTIVETAANTITINGRCAAPEGSRGFKTRITDNGDGTLSGVELSRLGVKKPRPSYGTLTESGIEMAGADPDGTSEFRLLWLETGQIRMQSGSATVKRVETADVVFGRRDR